MQTLFQIGNADPDGAEAAVYGWELGSNYALVSSWQENRRVCTGLSVYTFPHFEAEESVQQLISDHVSGRDIRQLIVCAGMGQTEFLPATVSMEAARAAYPAPPGLATLYDPIPGWSLAQVYNLPLTLYDRFRTEEPGTHFCHPFTALLKGEDPARTEDLILLHIVNQQFRVLVLRGGQLQMGQTYGFTAPMDVLYYLLKITGDLGLSQDETVVRVSGFIEQGSPLYRELTAYFLTVDFAPAPLVELPEHQYPPHYFSSLDNLVACAS